MKFLQENKKYTDFPTGPCLYETKKYIKANNEFIDMIYLEGYAIDT